MERKIVMQMKYWMYCPAVQISLPGPNFCSLDRISVGTHETNPTMKECTDCDSFELKSGCC